MVILSLLSGLAFAAGFHASAGWTSNHGPDATAEATLAAEASPGLEVGVLAVGGTRSALFATGARELGLGEGLRLTGELRLGMVEQAGAEAGFNLDLGVQAGPVLAVAGGGWTGGLGWRGYLGADAPLTETLTLSPRLRAETWAGDRDLAVRAAMGLRHVGARGLIIGVEASAGGRDVFHLGPGVSLTLGRRP